MSAREYSGNRLLNQGSAGHDPKATWPGCSLAFAVRFNRHVGRPLAAKLALPGRNLDKSQSPLTATRLRNGQLAEKSEDGQELSHFWHRLGSVIQSTIMQV
jgi:hypothetical protein